jgi:hypothetical protein
MSLPYNEIHLKVLAVRELMRELRDLVNSLDSYFYVDSNPTVESLKFPERDIERLQQCIAELRKLLPELDGKLCMMAGEEIGVIQYPKKVLDAIEFYVKAIKKECSVLELHVDCDEILHNEEPKRKEDVDPFLP